MVSHNYTLLPNLFKLLLLCILSVFILYSTPAYANLSSATDSVDFLETKTCPINNVVRTSFSDTEKDEYVEDFFSKNIDLINDSTYTFSGVRIAVAVYKSTIETPAYWMVLPEEYQLPSNTSQSFFTDIDLSVLPAGEYILKVFAMQGDETALLGAVLRDSEKVSGITIIKSTTQKNKTTVTVTVNDSLYKGQSITLKERGPLAVKIETNNANDFPLLKSSMLGVITQGKVPLGSAVRADKLDPVKLIPGATLVTKLTDNFVEGGKYTIYAGLISPNTLSPLVKVLVIVSDSDYEGSWSYVSMIGLSSYPLRTDSEVVACVGNIGANENLDLFLEPLQVEFAISTKDGDVVTKKLNSLEVETRNYFSFKPNLNVADFMLATNLYQQRFNNGDEIVDSPTSTDSVIRGLTIVDTIKQSYICGNSEWCTDSGDISATKNSIIPGQKPFWFYAGILIAAALLLYIMLRRLPPEYINVSKRISSDELQ